MKIQVRILLALRTVGSLPTLEMQAAATGRPDVLFKVNMPLDGGIGRELPDQKIH